MKLIFKIINNPSCGAPSDKTKIFGTTPSVIGRSASSDWVLPDPDRFISSKHAEVFYRNNQFYLRDVSSNGTINGLTDEPIGTNQEILISDGQTFLIGEYLIQAELESISHPEGVQPASSVASEHADWDNQMDDFWGNSADPLDLLAPKNSRNSSQSLQNESPSSFADNLERTPAFKQAMSFSAPISNEPEAVSSPISSAAPALATATEMSGIPEDWDNTSFSFPEPQSTPPPSQTPVQIPEPIFKAEPNSPEQGLGEPKAGAASSQTDLEYDSDIDDDFFLGLAQDGLLTEDSEQLIAPVPSKLERPASTRPRKRQQKEAPASAAQNLSNNNLLDQAKQEFEQQGLNKDLLTEDVASQWLSLMPIVMQSTIELLQARAAIKNEFRVSKTLLTSSENNPLKFSTNAEDAIHSLFHQNRPGFLNSNAAFQQAFADINQHQSALLHGVRVAMMDLLKQFDAEALEESFTRSNKSNGLLDKFNSTKSSQAKLWQQYKELYKSEYKVDSDDNFQRIFGETFAQAYDEFSSN